MSNNGNRYTGMKLEAMVLDDRIAGRDAVRSWKFDYRRMESFLSPEVEPLGNNQNVAERGIWLRWILPPNLREEKEDGGFPEIPNRYLIVRVSERTGEMTARVLEIDCPLSDVMDDKSYGSILPYTTIYLIGEEEKKQLVESEDEYRRKGYYEPASGGGGYYTNFGVPFPAEEWKERDDGRPFLTACAPGNPDYTGYIRFHSNMLAFFDDLKGHREDVFHYFVTGWYSSGAHSGEYYNGRIFSVKWKKTGYPVSDQEDPYGDELQKIRRSGSLNVTIGENSTDALRTWLQKKLFHEKMLSAEDEKKLEWILAAYLSGKDGRFHEEDGGWKLRDDLKGMKYESAYGGAGETEELDREIEVLHSLQKELQTLWWKRGYLNCHERLKQPETRIRADRELDPAIPDNLLHQTIEQLERVKCLYDRYGHLTEEELVRQKGRYFRAGDPYLLLSGVDEPKDWDMESEDFRTEEDLYGACLEVPEWMRHYPDGVQSIHKEDRYVLNTIYPEHITGKELPSGIAVEIWRQPWKPAFAEWRICYEEMEGYTFGGSDYSAEELGGEEISNQEGYTGRMTLDGHKKKLFMEQLGRMEQVFSEGQLSEVLEAVEQWKMVGQELSGFIEQMGQRDYRTFRRPYREKIPGTNYYMEEILGYAASDAGFFDRVGGIGESVPCVRDNVIPKYRLLQRGKGYLKDLVLYDAFGRMLEVITSGEQQGMHSSDRFPLLVSGAMRGSRKESGYGFLLKPALLQFSRLSAEFQMKGESPYLGLVIPNYLDHSLIVYNNQGEELGYLMVMAVSRTERRVVFVWRKEEALREAAEQENQDLFALIRGMEARTEEEFSSFLDSLEASFWTMRPAGGRMEERRALLLGRTLAISRIDLALERYGLPRKDDGWSGGSGEDELQTFPVKLGNASMRADGLAGYFEGDNYERFFCRADAEKNDPFVEKIGARNGHLSRIGFKEEGATSVLVFYDPLLSIHIYTGILPVKKLDQDREDTWKLLERLEVSLRTGPVMTQEKTAIIAREGDLRFADEEGKENEQDER